MLSTPYKYNFIDVPNCVVIDNKLSDSLKNIKIELKTHQLIILQKLINIISNNGKYKCESKDYTITGNNSNIWIKLDVGVGKSLIILSLINYFKENEIDVKNIPLSTDIATRINLNSSLKKTCELINPSYFEIIKDSGIVINESITHEFISYDLEDTKSIPSILFVQSQVLSQFEDYIKDQTNLSYIKLSTVSNILEFMMNPNFSNDIILIDSDSLNSNLITIGSNGENIFYDIINSKREKNGEEKLTSHEINLIYSRANNMFDLKSYSNLQQTKYTNKFLYSLQKIFKNPFKFLIFDDYDLISMESFYKPYSLYSIYVSGTKISNNFISGTNCIKLFTDDDFLNSLSCITIDNDIVQEIIKIPEHTNIDKKCKPILSSIVDTYLFSMIYEITENLIVAMKDKFKKEAKLTVKFPPFNNFLLIIMNYGKDFTEIYKSVFSNLITSQQLTNEFSLYEYYKDLCYYIEYIDLFCDFSNGIIKENKEEKTKHLRYLYSKLSNDLYVVEDDYHIKTFINFVFQNLQDIKSKKETENTRLIFKVNEILKEILKQFKFKLDKTLKDINAVSFISHENFNDDVPKKINILSCCNNIITDDEIKDIYCRNENGLNCKYCGSKIINTDNCFIQVGRFTDKFLNFVSSGEIDIMKFDEKTDKNYDEEIFDRIKKTLDIYENNKDKNFMIFITSKFEEERLKKILKLKYGINTVRYTKDIKDENKKVIIVNSLKEIIGVNMTWVDIIIIYDKPDNQDEIKQIIGRTHRLGRETKTESFCYYY